MDKLYKDIYNPRHFVPLKQGENGGATEMLTILNTCTLILR